MLTLQETPDDRWEQTHSWDYSVNLFGVNAAKLSKEEQKFKQLTKYFNLKAANKKKLCVKKFQ